MYDMGDGDVNMSINTFERAVAGSVRCFYDLYQPYTPSFMLTFDSQGGSEVAT